MSLQNRAKARLVASHLCELPAKSRRAPVRDLALFQPETALAANRRVVRFDTISISRPRSIVVVQFAVIRSEASSQQGALQEFACEQRIRQTSFHFLGRSPR